MNYIKKHHIHYLYHMTNIRNLNNILKYGLLSHEEAHRHRLIINDISNQSVQARRGSRIIYNIPLHRYVCFYFSPRNPMLYALREFQDEIIFIGTDAQLLLHPNTIFSDGNAASDDTAFYKETSMLDNLAWNIINAVYWNNYDDGRRIKCAEILAPERVDTQYIIKIFCYNNILLNTVQNLLSQKFHVATEINTGLYF